MSRMTMHEEHERGDHDEVARTTKCSLCQAKKATPAFSLKQGYGFLLIDDDWKAAPNDDWETIVLPDYLFHNLPATYVGQRNIDDAPCAVFQTPGGFWAQTVVMARDS